MNMKQKTALTLILALMMPLFGTVADARRLPELYTQAEKAAALSTLWSEIKYNFVFIDRLDFDIDSLYNDCMEKALDTKNDVEFFWLLKRFMAHFNDGHTDILSYSFKWDDVFDSAPIWTEEIDRRYYISTFYESSGLDASAIGAEIIEIDGVPTLEYVEKNYLPYIQSGSERMRYHLAQYEIGTGMPGSRFRATLHLSDGEIRKVNMRNNSNRLKAKGRRGQGWKWPGAILRTGGGENVSLDWIDSTAVLAFRKFDDEDIHKFDSLFHAVGDSASGLVIDLRQCSGGSSVAGDSLLRYIIDRPEILSGGWKTRINNAYGRAQGNWREEYKDFYEYDAFRKYSSDTIRLSPDKAISCPVVILTGIGTASACETFLMRIKELDGHPPIVGERTEGSTGAPLVIDLPHGACARICTISHSFPMSGREFVNEGIEPDIEVRATAGDHISGHDRVMEYALKMICNWSRVEPQ